MTCPQSRLRRQPRRAFGPVVALCLALSAAACGGGGSSSGTVLPPDFRILSSTPVHGASLVPLDRVIDVRFTRSVDAASVRADSLIVTAAGRGRIAGTAMAVQGGDRSLVRWVPAELLPEATDHVCQPAADIRSEGGEELGVVPGISFRTATAIDPLGLPQQADLRQTLGSLATGRQSHCATLLADGRVLVTGGVAQFTALAEPAEIYDPGTDQFVELAAPLVQPRAAHTATRLAGEHGHRVLLVGGRFEVAPGSFAVTPRCEIYDVDTAQFVEVDSLTVGRYDHATVLLADGKVLVCGGTDAGGNDLEDVELFDPATGQWSSPPLLLTAPRATHGIVPLGPNRFLVWGGSVSARHGDILDLSTMSAVPTNAPAGEGQRFGAMFGTFASGASFMAGGDNAGFVVHAYAGTAVLQSTGSPLFRPRNYGTSSPLGPERWFIAGGIDFSQGGFIDGSCDIIIEGGVGGSRTFATPVRFPTGMARHTATVLLDGSILFTGGLNVDGALPNLKGCYILEVD